jgi:hypothetical protein
MNVQFAGPLGARCVDPLFTWPLHIPVRVQSILLRRLGCLKGGLGGGESLARQGSGPERLIRTQKFRVF